MLLFSLLLILRGRLSSRAFFINTRRPSRKSRNGVSTIERAETTQDRPILRHDEITPRLRKHATAFFNRQSRARTVSARCKTDRTGDISGRIAGPPRPDF
jgi:hypothetical protein